MLTLDISLGFPDFTLQVTQSIALQGVTAIFGRSGSGKSTLLRIIAGLEHRAKGQVGMAGTVWQDATRFVAPEKRGIGYVFQDTRLFPHLSVRGNLDYALRRARGLGGPSLDEVVTALDLGPLLARRPAGLSGGEKQRVGIGRALLTAPRVLLMDEPLAALDEARKAEILPYLERLRDNAAIPILYVSHSLNEVSRLARDMIVLRDGRVLRHGPAADLFADPESVPIFGVRDAGAIITARIAGHEADGLTRCDTSAGPLLLPRINAAPGAALRIRIHAQDVILARHRPEGLSALNILPAIITALKLGEGPGVIVQLRLGQDLLLARITRRSAQMLDLREGMAVYAILKSVAVAAGDVGETPA